MKDLPKGWTWTRLKDIGKINSGGTPSTKEPKYFEGDIPWITPADLSDFTGQYIARGRRYITQSGLSNSSAKLLPTGTVLFSSRAPIGYVAIAKKPMATNQGFKNITPSDKVTSEYLYYYLKSAKQLAEKSASGTTFLEISGKKFGDLPIPLTSVETQKNIVIKLYELFSELDKAVASLKKAQEQLKVYRQAALKAAFEGRLV